MLIIETKFGMLSILTFMWWNITMDDCYDSNCNNVNLTLQFFYYKEWQIMVGLLLVLVTLHGQFTISIENKIYRIGDTK